MIIKPYKLRELFSRISWLLLVMVFVSIPILPILTKFFLILFIVVTIINIDFLKINKIIINDSLIKLYLLFYIIIVFWLFKSDFSFGQKKLETQCLFFLLPIIFCFVNTKSKDYARLLEYFVIGTSIACISLYILALVASINNGSYIFLDRLGREQNYFQYVNLTKSLGHHPSYFSMYISFSIVVLFNSNMKILTGFYKYGMIVFLILTLFLVNSKMGIVAFLAVFILDLRRFFKKFNSRFKIIFSIIAIVISSLYFLNSSLGARFGQVFSTLNKDFSEAIHVWDPLGQRLKLWYISSEIINDNWLSGTGTGTVKSSIISYCNNLFESRRCVPIKNFNAHNQFLESFIAYGITGFLIIISFFVFLFKKSFNNPLILGFTIILFLNCLTESILEREMGVMFFLLVSIILILNDNKNETC